jgi:hypothetical protein
MRTCNSDGTFSSCTGEVTPTPEICDYIDNDCNGIVDDVAALVEAGAIFNCNSPACAPNATLMTQDYTDAAVQCWTANLGICGAGVKACQGTETMGGQPTGCTGYILGGVPEVCNGIDDDCNGQIDDGLTMDGPCTMDAGSTWAASDPDADLTLLGKLPDGGKPTAVLGQCIMGNLACMDTGCNDHFCTGSGDQCQPSTPVAETCNGLDDDCNGIVDDHACANPPYAGAYYCCTYGMGYGYCDSYQYAGCVLAK